MARVIHGGSDIFDAMIYAPPHPSTLAFIDRQFQEPIIQPLGVYGQRFIEASKSAYDSFRSSDALKLAHLALNRVKGYFQSNTIRDLSTLNEIRNAPPVMQRYIMSHPDVKRLYEEQRCQGYETYTNPCPGLIEVGDLSWCRVMTGVIQEQENTYKIDYYLHDDPDDEPPLTPDQQHSIISTWRWVDVFLHQGQDPTDPWEGKL